SSPWKTHSVSKTATLRHGRSTELIAVIVDEALEADLLTGQHQEAYGLGVRLYRHARGARRTGLRRNPRYVLCPHRVWFPAHGVESWARHPAACRCCSVFPVRDVRIPSGVCSCPLLPAIQVARVPLPVQ